MVKKAIFGGTFDPIHNGHLHVAYEALERFDLDNIIFMPSGNQPLKINKPVTNAEIRYEMVNSVINNEPKFNISRYEIDKKGLSYTYETLEYFNRLEKNTEWYFLTGADCLVDIYMWKNVPRILELCKFLVFSRGGYSAEKLYKQKEKAEKDFQKEILLLNIPALDISSTNIRERIKQNKNVSYLMPEAICEIIKQFNLYK